MNNSTKDSFPLNLISKSNVFHLYLILPLQNVLGNNIKCLIDFLVMHHRLLFSKKLSLPFLQYLQF